MKKLLLLTVLIVFISIGYSQSLDSTWNAEIGYKGVPTGIVHEKWSDSSLYFVVKYQAYHDSLNVYQEILKLQVNWDSVYYYKPVIHDNMINEFFNSAERTFLILMAREAAKERYFGYKRYFK